MKPSLTPILLAIQLTFFFVLAWRSEGDRRQRAAVWLYLLSITIYGVANSVIGATGAYVADDLLEWLPALWLQLVTVAFCVLPVVLSREVRNGLRRIVDSTPWHWFAYYHGLRVAAIGTAYKTFIGEFPHYFELLIGVPDLAFGVSAFWIASKAKRGLLSRRTFVTWNLIGALVIVPAAPILLQLGLPGPLQVFTGQPDARVVFTFPMSIASMIGVPLFVLTNLLVAWRLWEAPSRTTTATAA
jgi:hypothetical protein